MATDRKKRRTGIKRPLSYAVAVVVTLVIAAVILTRSPLLPYEVARYVNNHYLKDSPFQFRCERISGNLFRRVVLSDVSLRYHARDASFDVFRAGEIEIVYSLRDVLRLNLIVDDLALRDVAIRVQQGEDGDLVLPVPVIEREMPRAAPISPRVDVRAFAVDGLQVAFGGGGRELAVRDVRLAGSFRYEKGVGELRVGEGAAYLINSERSVSELRFDLLHEGGTLRVRDLLARLDESLVTADGAYSDGRFAGLRAVFNPISLGEVHALGLAPPMTGEFGGHVIVDGALDSLRVSGTLTGTGFGVALTGLSFRGVVAGGVLDLAEIEGDVFGSRVHGAFRYDLAGTHDVYYEGDCEHLDLRHGFVRDPGVPSMSLTGHVRFDHQAAAGRYAFDATLGPSSLAGYEFQSGVARGTYTMGVGLEMTRAVLEREGYTVEAQGRIAADGVFDAVVRADGDDLTYFWDFFDLPRIEGGVSITARVAGPVDDLRVNLNGAVSNVRFLFAGVDSGRVQAEVRGVGGPSPSLRLGLGGSRGRVFGVPCERPQVYLEVDSGVVNVREARIARGDTTLVASFVVRPQPDGTARIDVRRAAVNAVGTTWTLAAPTVIHDQRSVVRIDSLVLGSPHGSLGVAGSYAPDGAGWDLDLWGEHVDVGVMAALLPAVAADGDATFHASIRGAAQRPRIDLSLEARRGFVDSVAFDVLSASARFDPSGYHLERLRLVAAGDTLRSAKLAARARAVHFPVNTVASLLRRAPVAAAVYTGTVEVSGTLERPRIAADGVLEPRAGPGLRFPALAVRGACADGVLRIDEVDVRGPFDARFTGTLPLRISFTGPSSLDSTGTVALDLEIRESDLALVQKHLPGVREASGAVAGRGSLRGTLDRPVLSGEFTWSDGRLRLARLEERFEGINARLLLAGSQIRLASLSARSEQKGALFASGTADVAGLRLSGYRFDVTLREMWIRSIPDFVSQQDGTLVVASVTQPDGRVIPRITGRLDVREATLNWTFSDQGATQSALTRPSEDPGWLLSLDLSADNNAWIRNPDLDVEMRGDVILKRDEEGLYLRGDMTVLRGTYRIYSNKFRITEGTLNFSTAESLRPEVFIEAYTPYKSEGGVERRIYLSLQWPQDKREPTVQLSYDEPGYYESDLWRMLGGSDLAGGFATNALERALNEQMSGLTVEIERRTTEQAGTVGDPERETVVGVGTYLWEDFYLRYRQGLALSAEQAVQVEYQLNRLFLVRSEFIRNSRRGYIARNGQYTDEFNFDVKFRFEY
jgi:hypothetical protein